MGDFYLLAKLNFTTKLFDIPLSSFKNSSELILLWGLLKHNTASSAISKKIDPYNLEQLKKLIQQFGLQPHPEGGWYKQTYKSSEHIAASALPERFDGDRAFSTAIYFLLGKGNFSAFHKIKSDECWHFYAGEPLLVYIILPNGIFNIITLGNDFEKGQRFQYVVPAGCWFASRPAPGSEYSFVGCTVSPGFEFEDFELASVNELSALYPIHKDIISELCVR